MPIDRTVNVPYVQMKVEELFKYVQYWGVLCDIYSITNNEKNVTVYQETLFKFSP